MIRVVSWNIAKRWDPWLELSEMARLGEVDVALLQEAGSPPHELVHTIQFEDNVLWSRHLYDRWPLVVQLSDRVEVEGFRQVPPISELGESDIGVSGIGTLAVAKVTPLGRPEKAFVAASMYARWMKPHPSTRSPWRAGASDVSALRILSDLSALIGHEDPSRHRILAAGPRHLYEDVYCARGQVENLIKLHKGQLASDRTSCQSPLANQLRLFLHTGAYWMMLALRDAIPRAAPLARAEFATLRLRLLKIGARVVEKATRVRIHFASACPDAALFRLLAGRLAAAGP